MDLKDVKDRVADALETENPPGVGYYGTELDESEMEADRDRIDENKGPHEPSVISPVPPANPQVP